ncbi:MAG: dTDP-4-dehydrorhamnose reductase [Thermoleophilia bacterium]|nr:dTDP-4-dehydrorhamnose reductase [Thermoleophilia bacterium]
MYGESKLAGEAAIRDVMGEDGNWTIALTAWLFSAQPPNFVLTIAGLAAGRPALDVVDDQRGNPTWCGHLADALVTCVLDDVRGVRHLVDAPEATWKDLAACVVETTGAACDVRPTTSDAYPRPAKRAAVSVLRVTAPGTPAMGDWRDGVRTSLRSTATIG